ncbi:MAG: hypothetical protein EOO16_20855 [Chitinophagaceae bacterium]|nr:MAG: hypothetical protein EOO16_20855 [Chitinophagaceae bacterium]
MRLTVFLLSVTITACTVKESHRHLQIERLVWLEGRWAIELPVTETMTHEPEMALETWRRENDSTMFMSFALVADADTSATLWTRFEERSGRLEFSVGKEKARHPLTLTEGTLIAGLYKVKQDFPELVRYWPTGPDSAMTEITLTTNGKRERHQFRMKKLP